MARGRFLLDTWGWHGGRVHQPTGDQTLVLLLAGTAIMLTALVTLLLVALV